MFPLFKVPYIVLVEILKNTHPSELICLSLCSRKSHSIVKNLWKLPENAELQMSDAGWAKRLYLSTYDEPLIGIEKKENCPKEKTKSSCNVNIGNSHQIKCDINDCGYLDTFWKNERFGFQEVTNYICDLFKTHVKIVSIFRVSAFWMFDWIKQRQIEEVKDVYVEIENKVCEEKYLKLLRMTPTNSLSLYVTPPDDFRFPENLPGVKHLSIQNANWLKKAHLLGLNSETVIIENSKFTNSNINLFIKHWLSGGFPRLKYFGTDVGRRARHGLIYKDIEDQLEKVEEERTYVWKTGEEPIRTDHVTFTATEQPYDIRRESDGIICTCSGFRKDFAMIVWPDYDGNNV